MQKCPSASSGMAGKAESCKGCPNANICASSKPDEDIPAIQKNLKQLKLILAILSGKGGVGKSTIARNIASRVAAMGIRTAILDFDLSGPSIPRLTKTENEFVFRSDCSFAPIVTEEEIGVISIGHLDDQTRVFNTNTKNYAIKKILKHCDFSGYDVMVVDTPPNITEEHLALVNYVRPQYSIMVTTPQNLSLNDVRRQIAFCNKAGMSIMGMVENMKNFHCPRCSHINVVYPNSGIEEFCKNENIEYFGSIPLNKELAKNSDSGDAFNHRVFDDISSRICAKLIDRPT
ncbi:uncharacterized protein VICG_00192 [Vittaforma corneae ATCC 50505]|uniref:Uncharacterized protein n=1 Tax=Vittaforma corneae (strain ATCC 50505) TaxID=993615 RepID=L2GRC2_VITCO|nr:uncharacterized protein VICG_00192 [Vittaforma corneae ATCC 50505]ELA42877.1 hypothetical protein VICG_00192 [Vittaforma corneae ATCC 50505]